MTDTPIFTQEELELMVDLLERERRDLPSEIHHTQTWGVKEDLRERMRTIEHLLGKMHQPVG